MVHNRIFRWKFSLFDFNSKRIEPIWIVLCTLFVQQNNTLIRNMFIFFTFLSKLTWLPCVQLENEFYARAQSWSYIRIRWKHLSVHSHLIIWKKNLCRSIVTKKISKTIIKGTKSDLINFLNNHFLFLWPQAKTEYDD